MLRPLSRSLRLPVRLLCLQLQAGQPLLRLALRISARLLSLLPSCASGGVPLLRLACCLPNRQQLLLGVYQQLARQIGLGNVELHNRSEIVDIVTVDGTCAGIVTRDLVTGEVTSHSAHATILATGGYSNAFFLSTNAMACNVTAAWRAHRKGAAFANPCYTQIHPTCIPQSDDFQSKLTLMSESLRNDGRIWVPKDPDDTRSPDQIPEAFVLAREGKLATCYIPFESVNAAAKVVIVGITPGFNQWKNAVAEAQRQMRRGATAQELLHAARLAGAFSGAIRPNLLALLDAIGVQRWLGIASCATIFGEHADMVQVTGVLRHAVFVNWKNYSGAPNMTWCRRPTAPTMAATAAPARLPASTASRMSAYSLRRTRARRCIGRLAQPVRERGTCGIGTIDTLTL